MNPLPEDRGDADLRRLLGEAVDDVEPSDRLAAIRAAVHDQTHADQSDPHPSDLGTKVTPMSNRRPWLLAVTGAAVATAAVLATITLAGGDLFGSDEPEPAAASGSASESADPTDAESAEPADPATSEPADDRVAPEAPEAGEATVAVYYAGDGPAGPVLFREFHRAATGDGTDAELVAALREAVSGTPLDPDYRSSWPAVTVQDASSDGGVITVDLDAAPARGGLSDREAQLAVQQVVYTAQGSVGARQPVRFTAGGSPVDSVLGVDTSSPVGNARMLDTLSRMSITFPSEGETVSGTFDATGVNNSFEATVAWEVRDGSGTAVADGVGIAEGYMAERLFPWSVPVDVSGLAPGTYTFVAMNDDPTGAEPASDTRTIVVR